MIGVAAADGTITDENTECTISLVDQRDWGGCVDVQMQPANALAPPAPAANARAQTRRAEGAEAEIKRA